MDEKDISFAIRNLTSKVEKHKKLLDIMSQELDVIENELDILHDCAVDSEKEIKRRLAALEQKLEDDGK